MAFKIMFQKNRNSPVEVFLAKVVLKIFSTFIGKHPEKKNILKICCISSQNLFLRTSMEASFCKNFSNPYALPNRPELCSRNSKALTYGLETLQYMLKYEFFLIKIRGNNSSCFALFILVTPLDPLARCNMTEKVLNFQRNNLLKMTFWMIS